MNVLILGGCGFIGSHVAKKLVKQNHNVILTDLVVDTTLIEDIKDDIVIKRLDILEQFEIFRIIKDYKITHIVNMVSYLTPESQKNPYKALQINCVGMNNIFEISRLENIKRIVWTSSNAVYGSQYDPKRELTEIDIPNPETVYSACKYFNEKMATNYFMEYGIDSIGLRFGIVYGYGRKTGSSNYMKELIEKPFHGIPAYISLRSDQEINWLHVTDAANSIALALNASNPIRQVFNIPGEVATFAEVAVNVKKHFPEATFNFGKDLVEWPSRVVDNNVNNIGYECKVSVQEGIVNYLKEMRKYY